MPVNITLPVLNEERQLPRAVEQLTAFLRAGFGLPYEIVIVDNGSTDGTWPVARQLESKHPEVRALRLDQRGRGRALRQAWQASQADVLSYMDVDLSTGLEAFPALVNALPEVRAGVAVGSRLLPGSRIQRCLKRELISRGYNLLVRALFGLRCSDLQCGFKAMTRQAADVLLPLVEDNGWFLDTELLLIADRLSIPIRDIPVRWVEDSDSRVRIVATAWGDLRGLARVWRRFHARPGLAQAGSPRRETPTRSAAK